MKAKSKGSKTLDATRRELEGGPKSQLPLYLLGFAAAVLAAFWAYSPALHGPFMFDDQSLQFALPSFAAPLRYWVSGLRPILMFTYWVNVQISGADPYSYHVVNVLIHFVSSVLVFFIVRRFLEWAAAPNEKRNLLAAFAGLLFLLHPVQTEAVAYLAGRSEALSVMLFFAAWAAFLYRPNVGISWLGVVLVLALFGAAVLSKEHTVVLPALLLLTDFWWNPGYSTEGIRRNWKLYAPMALCALGGVAMFWNLIAHAQTAGFALKDFTWYQYFFTEWRALFVYMREFVLPVGLTADWDFPISKSPLDHGAIVWGVALVALVAAAWIYRRRFPLAGFGFFAFLLLMAPTSSILPIQDPVAERRLYLGMLGLLLIAVDFLGRVNLKRNALAGACASALLLMAVATHARAALWADPIALWQDTVRESPNKFRAHFQLASAYFEAQRCPDAVKEFETASHLQPISANWKYSLLVDWGLAYDCAGQSGPALAKLRQAAALDPTAHVYAQIGKVYAVQAQWADALDALAQSEKIDPNFAATHAYKGAIYFNQKRYADAVQEYQRAVKLDPLLEPAKQGLQASINALQQMNGRR